MSAPPRQLSGVLLCHIGDRRLAVHAQEIAAIEPRPVPGRSFAHARRAFGLADHPGRVVLAATGEALVVDSLEVLQATVPMLPPPPALVGASGQSLQGFIEARDRLWPVVAVARFVAYSRQLPAIEEQEGVGL